MIKTTIIDFLAERLPDGAESYPDWTIRCVWARALEGEAVGCTFHAGTSEGAARNLAVFVLDRYLDVDVHRLSRVEILRPDGTWEYVPRPASMVTAPVMFAFQRLPERPDRRHP